MAELKPIQNLLLRVPHKVVMSKDNPVVGREMGDGPLS